jgi:hypothetical protein
VMKDIERNRSFGVRTHQAPNISQKKSARRIDGRS